MNQISLIPSDVAELARRRGLPPRGEPAKPSGRCCSVSSSGWNGKPAICAGGSRNGKQTWRSPQKCDAWWIG